MLGGYNFYLGFKKLKGEEHHWYKDKNLSFGAAWISVCIGYFILFFTSERILNIPLELFSAIFFLFLAWFLFIRFYIKATREGSQ